MCRKFDGQRVELEAVRLALPVLARLLHSGDDEVQTDASWALSYVSDGANERVQAVVEAGVAPRLVELLGSPNSAVITPVLRTLGNFVSGDDRQTQAVLDCGFLARCPALLAHHKRSVRKEASWAISNVTAGNQAQIQAVLDAGLLPRLVELLGGDDEPDVQKEACWAVSNATSGGSPPGMNLSTERRRFKHVPIEAPVSSAFTPRLLGSVVAWRRNFAVAAGSSWRTFAAAAFSTRAVRRTGSRRRFLYSASGCSGPSGRAHPTDRKTA
jgi:hypothetical protein